MAIIRQVNATGRIFATESDMIAAATGDLTRVFTSITGVFKEPFDHNALYDVEWFTDDNGDYFGLFKVK